jgi:N4-gp56 family major capsid protein
MAKTTVTTSDSLRKQAWEEALFRDTKKESYFSRFMGTGANSMVQEKRQLEKGKGDKITFGIRMRLSGDGVTSGQTLEGNEESLTTYNFNLELEEYAHAVRDAGPLDRKRPIYDMDQEHRDALKDWGSEKIDKICFNAMTTSFNRFFYLDSSGDPKTSTSDVASSLDATSSIIQPKIIDFAKTWCLTGGDRTQTPLRPIKINGRNHFVLLVHPDVLYDLRQDSTWFQAAREALPRGEDNPIFAGAEAMWNNVVIHTHENVPIYTNGGSGGSVPYAKCLMMGAQSLCFAWGKRPKVVAEEFDYQREHGFAWSVICGCEKPVFNSTDYGSAAVYLARTQVSDA